MANIYVVTSGSYSDYRIEHVFSTKEKAEAWVGVNPEDSYAHYCIEKHELDPDLSPVQWVMDGRINIATGEVLFSEMVVPDRFTHGNIVVRLSGTSQPDLILLMPFDHCDTDRAAKVLNEKRTQFKALNRCQPGFYDRETLEKLS